MRVQKVLTKEFEFYLADLDNLLLVKCESDGSVTVRATRANCSEQRKVTFIRRLAAEGFIPDEYQWITGNADESNGVRWVKDYTWLKISPVVTKRSRRFMIKMFLAAGLIWLAMMRVLVVSHPASSTNAIQQHAPGIAASGGAIESGAYLLEERR